VFRNNMTLAGADAFQIAIALAPTPKWVPAALVNSGLVRTARISGKIVIVGLSEGGEEVYQDLIQRRARGEEFQFDPVSKEVFALGFIMGGGMGLGGDIVSSIVTRSRDKMSSEFKRQFDADVARFKEEGFNQSESELRALDEIAQTSEGAEIVKEAVEETKAEVTPLAEEVPAEEVIPVPAEEVTLPAVEPIPEITVEPVEGVVPTEPVIVPEVPEPIVQQPISEPVPNITQQANDDSIVNVVREDAVLAVPEDTVQKLTGLIEQAVPIREVQEGLKHEELVRRSGRASAILQTTEGREAFARSKSALRGELPKADFAPPELQMTDLEIKGLFNQIKDSNLQFFQKLNTAEA
ncbi:hypothetical protein LCGC14_3065450, partial [marine sediment metagenome]